jgi:peptidoglycan/xylan/chitin deacetylase (PgdA/CDA1 family)
MTVHYREWYQSSRVFGVRLNRVILALAATLALAAACTGPPHAHWSEGQGEGGGGPVSSAVPSRPSASPSVSASPTASGAANPYLAMVPKFDPPPVPERIVPPAGPAAPIYHRLPVSQRVAFLTMDDGQTQLPEAIPLMRAAHIRFTMFLIAPVAAGNPGFFKQLVEAGGVVEDHTITHPEMRGKSYDFQHHEICGARSSLEQTFGTQLSLFRPPYGDYDQTTLRAVHDCGLKAAFHWSETVNDGKVFYQTENHHIAAGDIILMHFRPAFVQDVLAALTAIHDAGLTPALLEDYLS